MPVYDVTVKVEPIYKSYRVEAESLEEAENAATETFEDELLSLLVYTVEGEEADDQDWPARISARKRPV